MTTTSIKKHPSDVLKRPRITEKAAISAEKGKYVFEIHSSATKASVKAAVKELYKVTPVSVNIARTPSKKVFVRGKAGVKKGVIKAYVTLKKGETIELA
jgi:large subunit ribosomal protein L23